jgi:hypothetical protein
LIDAIVLLKDEKSAGGPNTSAAIAITVSRTGAIEVTV